VTITEKHRHDLFNDLERVLGAQPAETLMELLPPVGWAEVATKRDLDGLRAATQADIDGLRAAMQADIEGLRTGTKAGLDGLRAATQADIDGLRAATKADADLIRVEMATKDDLHHLRRDLVTWLLTAMGVQTAAVGLLFTVATR
jgi:hypothetical protein